MNKLTKTLLALVILTGVTGGAFAVENKLIAIPTSVIVQKPTFKVSYEFIDPNQPGQSVAIHTSTATMIGTNIGGAPDQTHTLLHVTSVELNNTPTITSTYTNIHDCSKDLRGQTGNNDFKFTVLYDYSVDCQIGVSTEK